MAWHPNIATQILIGNEDDRYPVIQVWINNNLHLMAVSYISQHNVLLLSGLSVCLSVFMLYVLDGSYYISLCLFELILNKHLVDYLGANNLLGMCNMVSDHLHPLQKFWQLSAIEISKFRAQNSNPVLLNGYI